MNAKLLITAAIAVSLGACGGEAPGTAADDGNLTQAGKKLIGAYLEQGVGPFRGLVLTSEVASPNANRFFADIDTGIVCVTTPCPTVERVEGTFTAGSKTLTLKSANASSLVQGFLGKYAYQVSGDKLSLSRKGFQQSLEHVDSYCTPDSAAKDCGAQNLIHMACVGDWVCSETASCGWSCEGVGPGECEDGTLVDGEDAFAPSDDGMECIIPVIHCTTNDLDACPQFSPIPPDYCSDGTVVKGPDSFVSSTDGKECKIPSFHCVTDDSGECPQYSPPPPDFCAEGVVVSGPDSFVPSADGKECQVPSIHCLTEDPLACPAQL